MSINSIPPVGLGAKERLGSPGTLAGMAPVAETGKSARIQPAKTNSNGDLEFSGGRGIVTVQPTKESITPLNIAAAQLRTGRVDVRA